MKHAREDYQRRIVDTEDLIPEDEPVMLFRAQDRHFIPLLIEYAKMVEDDPDADPRIWKAVWGHIDAARDWKREHGVKSPDLPAGDGGTG